MAEKGSGSPPPPYGPMDQTTPDSHPQPMYEQAPPQYNQAYPAQQGYPAQVYPPTTYPPPIAPSTVVTTTATTVTFSHYGEHPTAVNCPYCHQQIVTTIRYVNGSLAWIICLSLALAGLIFIIPWFICCIPFCMTSCQDVEHFCPSCKRMLGKYPRMR